MIGRMLRVVSVAVVLAWLGQDVFAQAPKYQRKVKVKVKVKQTQRTLSIKEKAKRKKPSRPQITADQFIQIQGEVSFIRNEQIAAIKQLIEETDRDNPELPDLYFRLAEIYAQQQRYWHARAMDMYAEIDKLKRGTPQYRDKKNKQKRFFDAAKTQLVRAIRVYKDLASNDLFRSYPRMDKALFYYAYMLQGVKKLKEARKVFHRLIQDHPNSKHIPEAYLAFAEYFFEQNSMHNAEKFYGKVLQFRDAPVYTYALYKTGWVYLNVKKHRKALGVFAKVVKLTKGKKRAKTINRAAKKDYVRAYAFVGKAQTAYKAFRRIDRSYAFKMLQILAAVYLDQGDAAKSIYTFRELMSIQPKHKLVCEWQFHIVQAMLAATVTKARKVKEVVNLVKLYKVLEKRNSIPPENLGECHDNAAGVNSELAKLWHNEVIKTLNKDTLAQVDRLYRLFLDNFPQSEQYGEMQYYNAELLWQRAEAEKNQRLATMLWERVAVAFTDVVKNAKIEEAQRKEAAKASVLAWKNALAVDPGVEVSDQEKGASDAIPKPKPLDPRQQKMIEAFDVYIDYIRNPKDDELVMMKFLKARIYWRHNHFDRAIPQFEDIIRTHIRHETAEYSANLLLDTLNRLKRYDEMIRWVKYLLKQKQFLEGREELAQRLGLLLNQFARKQAEQLETKGEYVSCGKAYLDIFNRNPNAENGEQVLYNSGVCFEKGKSIGAAISMFGILMRRFPKHALAQRAIARLGRNYAKIAWYDKAAQMFEQYARKYAGEKDAFGALSEAVFYRKGIGDDKQAISDTKYFVSTYGGRKGFFTRGKSDEGKDNTNSASALAGRKKIRYKEAAAAAAYGLNSIYEKQGDDDTVVRHLRGYLRTWGKLGGVDRQVIAHTKIGMILWKQSCPVRGVKGACVRVQRERSLARKKRRRQRSSLPKQCGPQSKIKLRVIERDPRLVREARRHFQTAIKLFEADMRGGGKRSKVPGAREEKQARAAVMTKYYAASRFFMVERDYEAFLALEFPRKLDFDPRNPRKKKNSEKRFNEWLKQKKKLLDALAAKGTKGREGKYRSILRVRGGGAHYPIAAAARIGQLSQNFSDALFTAPIPNIVRTGRFKEEKVDAYCDALTTAADPLEKVSVGAFGFCLETSTKLNWFNEWSKLCEKELGQIQPETFPTASEIHAEPNNLAAITDIEPPVVELAE